MRKAMIALLAGLALLAPATSASAGDNRADAYYEVWCYDPTGALVQAESVDAHAIEQGGKANQIDIFNQNHPGWFCWPVGPFNR